MKRGTLRPMALALILLAALLCACAPVAEDTPTAEDELRAQYGALCITEYVQEAELDGFDGAVCFVPYRPFGAYVYAEIIQDGKALETLRSYQHPGHGRNDFSGLDAVDFRDVDGDGAADIILIERFGEESFVSLFFARPEGEAGSRFYCDSALSERLTDRARIASAELTAEWIAEMAREEAQAEAENAFEEPETDEWGRISGKAGEFDDWQTAYRAVAEWYEREYPPPEKETIINFPPIGYDLIDVDGDDTPELAAGRSGHFLGLYTFRDGVLYVLMDRWAMGAGGNFGYEYIPGENSIMNRDTDYRCLHWNIFYVETGTECELSVRARVEFRFFDDLNGNGCCDSAEPDGWTYTDENGNGRHDFGEPSEWDYTTYWLNGEEISEEEALSYDDGRYRFISTGLSYEELLERLEEAPAPRS